jgi:alcohol dehydrogenase
MLNDLKESRVPKEWHMKAWQLDRLGGTLSFKDIPVPEPRPGSVLVRIEASSLMSYLKDYVEGKLPMYNPPKRAFTPGGQWCGRGARNRPKCLAH